LGFGFRVQGLGVRLYGLGLRALGLEFWVKGFGAKVSISGVWDLRV